MASTNKTPQLGLNQWAAGDSVLRADFNGDNLKIEAAVGGLMARGSCVAGTYSGDGTANRAIHVGFRPSFVFLYGTVYGIRDGVGFLSEKGCFEASTGGASDISAIVQLTNTGFLTKDGKFFNAAASGGNNGINTYVAFY